MVTFPFYIAKSMKNSFSDLYLEVKLINVSSFPGALISN